MTPLTIREDGNRRGNSSAVLAAIERLADDYQQIRARLEAQEVARANADADDRDEVIAALRTEMAEIQTERAMAS